MILSIRNRNLGLLLGIFLLGQACGQGKDPPAAEPSAQAVAPAPCPPPPPPCPPPPSPQELLDKFGQRPEIEKSKIAIESSKFQVMEKAGKKEISPEDIGRMVSFLWAVDPELRIDYLRALYNTNQLIDFLKPTDGKPFDPAAVPADPGQDVAFRISQVIVDWARVQAKLVDEMQALGIENVKAVSPADDFPQAEAMMQELVTLVKPPEPPAADKILPSARRLLLGEAFAQTQRALRGKMVPTIPAKALAVVKALPRIKVAKAPLLLARALSFKVGTGIFVLSSPLMAAAPEFSALPVEQFSFKLEKKFVGDAYFNAVAGRLGELANLPDRSQGQWAETAHALTEMHLLLKLVNPSFGEAPPPVPILPPALPSAVPPGLPPAGPPPGAQPAPPQIIPPQPVVPPAPPAPAPALPPPLPQ